MRMLYRVLFYVFGLLLISFGVAFSVNSNLGVSPVNSFPYAISSVTNIWTLGVWVNIIFCAYILVQVLVLRKDFKIKNLLQIAFSVLFGRFVDFAKWLVGDFAIPTYAGQLAMMAISIVLIAFGLIFYLTPDIVPLPMEGMALAFTTKLKKYKFHNVKIMCDCVSVALAVLVTLLGMLLRPEASIAWGVREGTVLSALLAGRMMAVFGKFLKPWVQRVCFGPAGRPNVPVS